MTSKEIRDFEEGRRQGYNKPHAIQKPWASAAYNKGMLEGKRQYWADKRAEEERRRKRAAATRKVTRRYSYQRMKDMEEANRKFYREWEGVGKE